LSVTVWSQSKDYQIKLKYHAFTPAENHTSFKWSTFIQDEKPFDGKRFVLIQFFQTLTQEQKAVLAIHGVSLQDYIPNYAYTATIATNDSLDLKSLGIRSITVLPPLSKIHPSLYAGNFPVHAVKTPNKVEVNVSISKGLSVSSANQYLTEKGYHVVSTKWAEYAMLTLSISQQQIASIIQEPFVDFVSAIHPSEKNLNDELRSNARANILQAPLVNGGYNLSGNGVTIGHGDDGAINTHIDLKDRVIDRTFGFPFNHATQTAGSAAGAGIKDPIYKGIAPEARIIAQNFGNIIWNAPAYVNDYNMLVTNNSYGAVLSECDYAGVYDAYSKILDDQAFTLPQLLHVFATGNDGSMTCGDYPQGYKTVAGAYQAAKNIIDVAWGDKNAVVSPGSSYGPVADGRIKPDIAATGSAVRSSGTNNNYVTDWGSSLAAPAVTGGAALLIEQYKKNNSNNNPKSGLVKALLLNGATDIGNPGPDYKSGFGWMNLLRSVDMLNQQRYMISSATPGNEQTHTIVVPANAVQLKVMLYWHDPSAAVFATQTLVNDLDLKLVTPNNTNLLPWILNPAAANVTQPATRGIDRINNVEQITIDNPTAGTYQIKVNGHAINVNNLQEYFLVYDIIQPTVKLTFPNAGEPLVPNEVVTINWDAYGNTTENFILKYSTDNGQNWNTIANNLPNTQRQLIWTVPSTITAAAQFCVVWGNSGYADTSKAFAVIPQPNVQAANLNEQCLGYAVFNWNAVSGATDYEVLLKDAAGKFVHQAYTTNTSYAIRGIGINQVAWVAVVARINGVGGRRSSGVEIAGNNNGLCTGNLGDGDLMLQSLNTTNGRVNTSNALTANTAFSGIIKNVGDAMISDAKLYVQIINLTAVEAGSWSTINPNQDINFTTPAIFNLQAVGSYTIKAWVQHNGTDPYVRNDTIIKVVKQLANSPVVLPFIEDFESLATTEDTIAIIGLANSSRWDFSSAGNFGRARSFVNTGIAKSGAKAMTFDVYKYSAQAAANSLTGTFNLTAFDTALHDIRLQFWFKHHGQANNAWNKISIRGNDGAAWITVYDLDANKPYLAGDWKQSEAIDLTQFLKQNQQQFSSSFQIRFGQAGNFSMGDDKSTEGFTFDDVTLFAVENDVELLKIVSPIQQSCGLSAAEQVTIQVKNNAAVTLTNIPVYAQLNGGAIVSTTVNSIGANSTIQITLPTTFNLSTSGNHVLKVWVGLPTDTYRANDTASITIYNQPLITDFPYLQNFESGQANWFANGENSSWQFGTPASLKINKAASGSKAWKTTLTGNYNDNERSYLYSPCFNTSALAQPWLSFSVAMDMEQCGQFLCDQAWVEYSNDGINWTKLGTYNSGYNWYNRAGDHVWDTASFTRWHVASVPLPSGLQNVRFRFVVESDGAVVREGVAIDDIHIYDRANELYVGPSLSNPITQNISGSSWVNVLSSAQIFTAIQPNNNNNLGNTNFQVFVVNSGFNQVRQSNNQYYLNRSFTIQPSNNNPTDSVSVRLFFTDAEADTLSKATGCNTCAKTTDAYELGITTFTGNASNENGTLADNSGGTYRFIPNTSLQILPYDKGYFAQFKTKSFGEFWLSKGNIGVNPPLPLFWQDIQLKKVDKQVFVQWSTFSEKDLRWFEVEVSNSANARFNRVAIVPAKNQSNNQYQITDASTISSGWRYYRIKAVGLDGSVSYSAVKSIQLFNAENWLVKPNPFNDWLKIQLQTEIGNSCQLVLSDIAGKVLLSKSWTATQAEEQLSLDIQSLQLAKGVYSMTIVAGQERKMFKLIKQ